MKGCNAEEAIALFKCGEISAAAHQVDVLVLESYLMKEPTGFNYGPVCKKILELAKLVQGVQETTTQEKKTE